MATVILMGELGSKFGRSHELEVCSVAEAVRALCANFKEFKSHLLSSEEQQMDYKIIVKDSEIDIDDIHDPVGKQKIQFVPVIRGEKGLDNPLEKIIVGSAIIAASFFLPGSTLFAVGATSFSIQSIAFSIGVSMALTGVSQMLTPTPDTPLIPQESSPNNVPSNLFNGPVNTTAQGHPVPVGYGRLIIGSAVISAGIDVDQVQV